MASGGGTSITARSGDATIRGSTVSAAEGGIAVEAGRDVSIEAVQDTTHTQSSKEKSGFFAEAGGGSATVGYRTERHESETDETTNLLSGLNAGSDVTIKAGRDVKSEAAQVAAGSDIAIEAGRDVDLQSVEDRFQHSERHETKQIGVTAQISSNVTSAACSSPRFWS